MNNFLHFINTSFNKTIKSKETSILIDTLEKEERNFINYESDGGEELCFKIIKEQIKDAIYTSPIENKEALTKQTPKQIIYNLIAEATADLITSGHNHIHAGILDEKGKIFYHFFKKTVDILMKDKFLSQEEGMEFIKDVEARISLMG